MSIYKHLKDVIISSDYSIKVSIPVYLITSNFTFPTTNMPGFRQFLQGITATEDVAFNYLWNNRLIKQQMTCPNARCGLPMMFKTCSASKYKDLRCWYCAPCKKYTSVRHNSILEQSKLSFSEFLIVLGGILSTENDNRRYSLYWSQC